MKKYFLTILTLLFLSKAALFATPLIGIAAFNGSSPRADAMSSLLRNHLMRIITTGNVFKAVNPGLLAEQLKRFRCLEEKCVLRFGERADIDVIITGSLEDRGETMILTLKAYGINIPYQGRQILSYGVEIPMKGEFSTREYSYICEEHSGLFLSELLAKFRSPLYLKDWDRIKLLQGEYTVYNVSAPPKKGLPVEMIQKDTIAPESLKSLPKKYSPEKDFILVGYSAESKFLKDFYYGRKKEIVTEEETITSTIYTAIFTVPASITMPVAAPFLGHYMNSDWPGLMLWSFNAAPYLYLEYQGFTDEPEDYEKKKKDIPSRVVLHNRFAWFFALTGGVPLFVDAFAKLYLEESSNYRGMQPVIGNDYTAFYLSLVSNGGGHFYRGERAWGTLYFHGGNTLLYFALKEFSPEKIYDPATDTYRNGDINKKKAYILASCFGALKITELIHVLFTRDNITSGTRISSYHEEKGTVRFAPLVFGDSLSLSGGIQAVYRF